MALGRMLVGQIAALRNGPDLHISIQARGVKGRIIEAGHTTAPDHMLDRCQENACIQGGVHTRLVEEGTSVRAAANLLKCHHATLYRAFSAPAV